MQWLMLVSFISKEMFRMAWTELWLWVKSVPGVFILRGSVPGIVVLRGNILTLGISLTPEAQEHKILKAGWFLFSFAWGWCTKSVGVEADWSLLMFTVLTRQIRAKT